MKNIRFKDDEKLSEIYEKVNLAPFRNYIYNFDGLGTYCDYLDEYECAIDNRDDKIEKYKDVIDKAIEYIKEKARNNCWIDQYESCNLIKILKGDSNE